jgi:hypothetical protein
MRRCDDAILRRGHYAEFFRMLPGGRDALQSETACSETACHPIVTVAAGLCRKRGPAS